MKKPKKAAGREVTVTGRDGRQVTVTGRDGRRVTVTGRDGRQVTVTGDPALERSWKGVVGPGGSSRADLFIVEQGVLSRSQIKARGAVISVNGKPAKPSRPLVEGETVELAWTAEAPDRLEAEAIALDILYEDERVLVVNKAQGMVTHPGAGNRRGTLANAALAIVERDRAARRDALRDARRDDALEPAAEQAPAGQQLATRGGIVHRLDKDTSGVIIVAKDLETQVFLASQFKERLTRKEYVAILRGLPSPPAGRIADRLGRDRRDRKRFASVAEGGKAAVTDYRVLAYWKAEGGAYSLVSLRPKTGRTHQLRVHMAGLGCPILGDPIYGRRDGRFPEASLMLHAHRLRISLPGRSEPSLFVAPLPPRFKALVRAFEAAFGAAISLR